MIVANIKYSTLVQDLPEFFNINIHYFMVAELCTLTTRKFKKADR